MWERIVETDKKPELHDAVLVVALSTSLAQYRSLYSHARELGRFMLKKMEFKKLATEYASALPPATIISDGGIARLTSVSYHYLRGPRDIILLTGDTSPVDEQYEFCQSVLRFAQEHGVKELISIGTRWTEPVAPASFVPKVMGFATDKEGVEELTKYGVTIIKDEPAPFFASVVVALAGEYGIRGYKLSVDHGEPIPHPKSLIELLGVLSKMLRVEISTKELEAKSLEMDASVHEESVVEVPPRERSGVYS